MISWVALLVTILVCSQNITGFLGRFPTNRNGDKFTNMVVKGTDTIYVAENGFVHTLDASLNPLKNFSTCAGDNCVNINKVLAVFGDMLVLCGTGNDGICQVWNGARFIYNSSTISEDIHYLVVSSDIDRPAVGLVHEDDLFLGVTYGPGIKTTENTYKHLLSRRGIKESFTTFGLVDLKDNINKNYLVYFKKVFEHEGFIYFLTNQKLKTDFVGYVSKIVRMCINETIENQQSQKPIKSYIDISMSCNVDDVDYNLLQDAVFLKENGILVTAFANGHDPEKTQSGSAICVYTIDSLNAAILKAKVDFITCNATGSIERESAYLDTDLQQCLTQSIYQVIKDDYICPKHGSGTKVIGTNTVQPTTTYRIEDTSITIKTVKGVERYSLYPDVFLGTDEGSMNKITILEDLTVFEYESREIDKGHPVLGIYAIENYTYVLTNRKVFRVKNTECSTFTTCKETMAAKNPSCGWCVGENKSKKRGDCTNTWLSSLSECVSMIVSPKYISVESKGKVDININTIDLPSNFTTSNLKCSYLDGNARIGGLINLAGSDGIFNCKDPAFAEHKLLRLQLTYMGTSNDFPLAETTIQVYKCTEYKKCGMCTISTEVNCKWCVSSSTCEQTQASCSGETIIQGNATECPRLLENTDVYIPNGISEIIELNTKNLVQGNSYKCVVENQTGEITANVNANGNTLTCALQITIEDDSSKKQFPISIRQKDGSRDIELDEDQRSYVTVYNCGKLASDCTMCNALKKARYSCSWCKPEESCVHNSLCSENITVCPAPKITKIQPDSIGYKGGATITISGTDFGTDSQEIRSVNMQVHGANPTIKFACVPLKIINQPDGDFGPFIKLIECTLEVKNMPYGGETLVDQVGNVTFFYNGSQSDPGTLTFKSPSITSIKPSFGPMAGGTTITLHGNNLLIGNKLNDVRLGTTFCKNHLVQADTQMLCTTPAVTRIFDASVRLKYDGESYSINDVSFSYLASPRIITDPSDQHQSILSGGTIMTFMGENLQNSAVKKTISIYANEKTEENCRALTATRLTCELPAAPESLKQEMAENGRRSTSVCSITAKLQIKLDGYEIHFDLKYYKDPYFDTISTPVLKTENVKLTLSGSYLTLAATADDYTVTIGLGNKCEQITVTETSLTCYLPTIDVEEGAQDQAVVVRLGHFYQNVTYVRYQLLSADTIQIDTTQNVLIIVLPIAGGLFLLGVIGTAVFCVKYRRIKARTPKIRRREHKNTQHDDVIGTPNRSTSFPTNRTDDQIMGQSTYMELDHSQNPGPNYESLDQNQDHDQQMIANQSSNTGIGQFNDPDTVYEGLDRNQDHDRHIYLGLDKKKVTKNV